MPFKVNNPQNLSIQEYKKIVKDVKQKLRSCSSHEITISDCIHDTDNIVVEVNLGEMEKHGSKYPFIQPYRLPLMINNMKAINFQLCDVAIKKKDLWVSFVKNAT